MTARGPSGATSCGRRSRSRNGSRDPHRLAGRPLPPPAPQGRAGGRRRARARRQSGVRGYRHAVPQGRTGGGDPNRRRQLRRCGVYAQPGGGVDLGRAGQSRQNVIRRDSFLYSGSVDRSPRPRNRGGSSAVCAARVGDTEGSGENGRDESQAARGGAYRRANSRAAARDCGAGGRDRGGGGGRSGGGSQQLGVRLACGPPLGLCRLRGISEAPMTPLLLTVALLGSAANQAVPSDTLRYIILQAGNPAGSELAVRNPDARRIVIPSAARRRRAERGICLSFATTGGHFRKSRSLAPPALGMTGRRLPFERREKRKRRPVRAIMSRRCEKRCYE